MTLRRRPRRRNVELRGHHTYSLTPEKIPTPRGYVDKAYTLPLPARHTQSEDSVSTPEQYALEAHKSRRSVHVTSKLA